MDTDLFSGLHAIFNLGSVIVSLIVWAVLAYFISLHAEKNGENKTLHFVLVFFAHLVGLAVSLILIYSKKNGPSNTDQNGRAGGQQFQQFGQNGQYGQNGQFGQNAWNTNTAQQRFICPSCGNEQTQGGFCTMCGCQIR